MSDSLTVQRAVLEKDGRVKYKRFRQGGLEHYNLQIWIDGPDALLDGVNRVDYLLHKSFAKPLRVSDRRDTKFRISLWTWGAFDIPVTVHFKAGHQQSLNFYLTYDLPPDDEANYINVGEY